MNIVLNCSFTGIPPPMVHWEKDGSVFVPAGSRRVSNQPGVSQLEIDLLTLPDKGEYTCVVTNLAGVMMQSRHIMVEG